MRRIKRIVIHCAATRPSLDIGADDIRNWHINDNGWADIGYHHVIRKDGTLEIGRPLARAGAHVAGHNADSIGVCLVGGVAENGRTPEANFTPEQWATLDRLVTDLCKQFPEASVHGHNEFSSKACPSFDVRRWLAEGRKPKEAEDGEELA